MSTTTEIQPRSTIPFCRQVFASALDHNEIAFALQHYHPRAAVHILRLNRPRESAELIVGLRAIGRWLAKNARNCNSHRVIELAETSDHITFHEHRSRFGGIQVLEENMVEITDGLITNQYVIIGWDDIRNA
jgi:hypothetical protein